MSPQDEPREDNSDMLEPLPEGMGTTTRILAIIFIFGAIAFWIFAFSPWARDIFQAPDQIADEAFVARIESTCAASVARLDALPSPRSADGPIERADIVEDSNVILTQLTDELAVLDGGTTDDQRLISLWLQDWEVLITDRENHVDRLRTEGDVRFLNTIVDDIFVAERMNGFARVNDILSCAPPGDLS